MTFNAPVVCQITRSIFDHANSDLAEVLGAPVGGAALALVFRWVDAGPVRSSEGDAQKFHLQAIHFTSYRAELAYRVQRNVKPG